MTTEQVQQRLFVASNELTFNGIVAVTVNADFYCGKINPILLGGSQGLTGINRRQETLADLAARDYLPGDIGILSTVDLGFGRCMSGMGEFYSINKKLPWVVLGEGFPVGCVNFAANYGAKAYVDSRRGDVKEELKRALVSISRGEVYFQEPAKSTLFAAIARRNELCLGERDNVLSPRQREIVGLIGKGNPTRFIADYLGISSKTVDSHVERAKKMLRVKSKKEITAWAVRCSPGLCV